MATPVEYQYLLPYQFEKRISETPLAYVPVGSLEWHGEHLALGNDSIKIAGLCKLAAKRSGGIVFPPLFFGIPGMTGFGKSYKHDGNFRMDPVLLKQLLLVILDRLEHSGFKAAILITGHTCGEQKALMREVAKEYSGNMKVVGTDDAVFANSMGHHSDHAAHWETSILWCLRPDLVDLSRLSREPDDKPEGAGGLDPRFHASKELGEKVANLIADELAELGKKLLES